MPSDSGEKLSPSRFGMPRSAGFLISTGRLRTCSVPNSSDFSCASCRPAQADFADAGAERVGDRPDALALRGLAREHRLLRAGVEDEVLEPAAVDARLHDDLVLHQPERQRVQHVQVLARRCRPASLSPNDSRNSTCARDHAAFSLRSLFGQQVDVVACRRWRPRRTGSAARRCRRSSAWISPSRGAAAEAVSAASSASSQAAGARPASAPRRSARATSRAHASARRDTRDRLRRTGRPTTARRRRASAPRDRRRASCPERLGLAAGAAELGDPQRRAHLALAGAHGQRGDRSVCVASVEGLQRFLVARLVEQQRRRAGTADRRRCPTSARSASVAPTSSAAAQTDARVDPVTGATSAWSHP